tara:strand:+ start:101 stop:496 length:396 start_codon:yes stop_codon:yes gene_type:complete
MSGNRKTRKSYSKEYKREIVEEYLSGRTEAAEIAAREGLNLQFIYRWKTQIEEWEKKERIGVLESEGMSPEDARKVRDLEEELEAYKAKVAEQALHIDLLKKLQPDYLSEKRSNGYAETKRKLARSKKGAK